MSAACGNVLSGTRHPKSLALQGISPATLQVRPFCIASSRVRLRCFAHVNPKKPHGLSRESKAGPCRSAADVDSSIKAYPVPSDQKSADSATSNSPASSNEALVERAAVGGGQDGLDSQVKPAAWLARDGETLGEQDSIRSLEEQLRNMREELAHARQQVRASENRVRSTLARLAELESLLERTGVVDPLPEEEIRRREVETGLGSVAAGSVGRPSKALNTTGRVEEYAETLKEYWYPVAFSRDVDDKTLVPIDCFEEPWVIFRGTDGTPGCIQDECAHRACPLSLGTVTDGRVACPYHGWEFSTTGQCEKMPSTKCTNASVRSLPCIERDGLIWIWPAKAPPKDENVPNTLPPSGYMIHAELVMELPVEHGLLVENLLDLAHAPFTHTTTFAKGWSVPSLVRFKTAATAALQGHWDPYPIAMEFRPPCMVVSTIGLAKPGQLEGGQTAQQCSQHLFQLHACIPSTPGKTRLLYRMGLDFASWVKFVPFIDKLWKYLANQVLDEDLRLVLGQQDRMHRGGNVWNHPVIYDKLGVRYRRWRNAVEAGERSPFF